MVKDRGSGVRFRATELTQEEISLQQEVREFLVEELRDAGFEPGLGMGAAADPDFSRKLGERGWLGMALPKEYGGSERGAVDRFIVTEELLAVGAPVGHHWVADRQSGAVIDKFGTSEQKRRLLPGICRGELGFSIGMSEPDAGSDLAAVRTRATKVEGGWSLSGTKVWTTGAHRNQWMIALCRTSDEPDRHAGLTQFLVDLGSTGVRVSPIPLLDGSVDFNEVELRDVFVPDELVLGDVGCGWRQTTAELAFERGGPDRFLSTYPVVTAFLREATVDRLGERTRILLGRVTATWWVLRNSTLALARAVDAGESPVQQAALIKELGTRFEQDLVEALQDLLDREPATDSPSSFERLLCAAVLTGPVFTIRGGTIEVLRSVVAKGLAR
ncbi:MULTISPECIES: acyl-CoA dehydrogenase family protein [Nocardia]|uniref:acyl-CoA dehydrogenase family protein n=1 Tax=Nocardia TaxID=1817 RepID=UPI001E2B9E82|nr:MULTISPECIES: acyl-CoA dehydrogenase family protein [Nocardia]